MSAINKKVRFCSFWSQNFSELSGSWIFPFHARMHSNVVTNIATWLVSRSFVQIVNWLSYRRDIFFTFFIYIPEMWQKKEKRSFLLTFTCNVSPLTLNESSRNLKEKIVYFLSEATRCEALQIDAWKIKICIIIWCTLMYTDWNIDSNPSRAPQNLQTNSDLPADVHSICFSQSNC